MIRYFIPLILLYCAGCDLDGPFNQIPCRHDLTKLHDTLQPFHLSSSGQQPKGFRYKSVYSAADLDCSSWEIYLAIDSINGCFFNERFVMMLARKVFDEPANDSFQRITFHLKQSIGPSATAELTYLIDRNTDTSGLRQIPVSSGAFITGKASEGSSTTGNGEHWKIVELELNTVPANAIAIANEFHKNQPQYRDVYMHVQQVPSRICTEVKYLFWYESTVTGK